MRRSKTFSRAAFLPVAIVILFGTACVPGFLMRAGTPDVVVVSPNANASQVTSPGSDAHFVQVDDYFVMEQPLAGQGFVYSALGKMLTAPAPKTDNKGKFRRLPDNQELWTQYYTKTRIAQAADYVLNKEVFFSNYLDSYGNYRAPESLAEAQNGWWMKARVSDISELHKGFLTVSGGYRVNLNALRVAAQ